MADNLKAFGTSEQLARDLLLSILLTLEYEIKLVTPIDLGTLQRSIAHSVEETRLRGVVGTNVSYAPYVQKRTKFLTKGVRNSLPTVDELLQENGFSFLRTAFNGD
ncbi:HK97 gp10 family phage protein [bacterium]|nr:HK97 gp10 family phage protein [bacterium]